MYSHLQYSYDDSYIARVTQPTTSCFHSLLNLPSIFFAFAPFPIFGKRRPEFVRLPVFNMASRVDGRSDAPLITRRRHVLACARCRARRVKCDRAQPACSNCVKVGALCQPVQNNVPLHSTEHSRVGSREPVEQNRLSKLEEQVARLSREVDSRSPSREPSHSPPPTQYPEDYSYVVQGRIVKGVRVSTYISPYSWAAAAEEVCRVILPFAFILILCRLLMWMRSSEKDLIKNDSNMESPKRLCL